MARNQPLSPSLLASTTAAAAADADSDSDSGGWFSNLDALWELLLGNAIINRLSYSNVDAARRR